MNNRQPMPIDNYTDFFKALYVDTPKPPCDGCPFWSRCAEKSLACYDFFTYVERGTFRELVPERPEGQRGILGLRSRNPNFSWYRKIFLLSKTIVEN